MIGRNLLFWKTSASVQQHQQPHDGTGVDPVADADALVQGHIFGPEHAGQAPHIGGLVAVHGALELAAGLHGTPGCGDGLLQHLQAVRIQELARRLKNTHKN